MSNPLVMNCTAAYEPFPWQCWSFLSNDLVVVESLPLKDTEHRRHGSFMFMLAAGIITSVILTYVTTYANALVAHQNKGRPSTPSDAPYWIPGLAHSLNFLQDASNLVEWASKFFPDHTPVRLKFLNMEVIFVSGKENVAAIWKGSRELGSKEGVCMIMEKVFATPKRAMKFYRADNSGVQLQPHPCSNIKQEHRIYYHNFRTTQDFLTGEKLKRFAQRMQTNLRRQVVSVDVGYDWSNHSDFYVFIQQMLFPAAVEAMCGSYVLSLNPTFTEDFWTFDNHFPLFFKLYPRWMIPKGYTARERCLQSVKKWLAFAHANFDESMISTDGDWDPYFGSQFIRSRQDYCSAMEAMDENAVASAEFGMIWATNANTIPSAFWLLIEVLSDPNLLARARNEIDQCRSEAWTPNNPDFDANKLIKSPLLQSVYAETLRLYVAVFPIRTSEYKDYRLKNTIFKKDKLVAISSRVAHMDETIWSTGGPGKPHPLQTFWAERFLVYPNDPYSGPRIRSTAEITSKSDSEANNEPIFSVDGLTSAWIPYGGGQRMCPGRFFAKQEMLLCLAMLLSAFDIEFDSRAKKPTPDLNFYGLGALPPKGRTPFRIRRRRCRQDSCM